MALLVGFSIVYSLFRLRRRRETATTDIDRLAYLAGLPEHEASRQRAIERQERRHVGTTVGSAVGMVVGVVPCLLLDRALVGAWALVGAVGTGIGAWLVHLDAVRSARASMRRRTAVLHRRRLLDYLTPTELIVQYGMLVLPAISAWLGIVTLAGDDPHAGRAAWLLVGAALAVLLVAACRIVQGYALRLTPPVSGEVELRWEDALRGKTVRDLMLVAVMASWAMGSLTAFGAISGWLTGYPDFFVPLTGIGLVAGTVVMFGSAVTGVYLAGPQRRSQRRYEVDPAR